VLKMFYEEGAESPLWDQRGTMICLDELPLSDDLRSDLSEWAKRADSARYSEREDESISHQGLALCQRTQRELGSTWRVDWRD
jgi:hypothetical protein